MKRQNKLKSLSLSLVHKFNASLERFASYRCSSIFGILVSDKKVLNIEFGVKCYKKFFFVANEKAK
jgi:hypothetical protein